MKIALFLFLAFAGCKFSGELTPNIDCTNTCDDDQQTCYKTCDTDCVNADGDTDEACDTDCHLTCDDSAEECNLTCTGS